MKLNNLLRNLAGCGLITVSAIASPTPYFGGTAIESFNNPAFNSKGNLTVGWVNGETVPGWYSTNEGSITYGYAGAVSDSIARMYGYRFDSNGNTSPVAGAIGAKTTDSSGPIHYAKAYINESEEAIDSFHIAFSVFVANFNVDPNKADKLSFSYKIGGNFTDSGYVELPDLDYVTEGGEGQGNPVSGTSSRLSANITEIDWQPGEVLWLRWTDHHDETYGGVAMGVDHIYFTTDAVRPEFYREWEFESHTTEMVEYHVNNQHPQASNANPGTEELPLLTIQRAVNLANLDSLDGRGSHIKVHPGIYREAIDIDSRPNNHLLILESIVSRGAVISGSDIFENWQPVDGEPDLYRHAWPYKFGWEPNPWPGDLALRYPEGTRRELLFINKVPMTQVIEVSELAEATYRVDESAEEILLRVPFGLDPDENLIEVSVRPVEEFGAFSKLIRVFRVNNVHLKGFKVEHAAAQTLNQDGPIAFRGSSNIIVEDMEIVYNNGMGLSISEQGDSPSGNVIIRNTVTNFNGALGMTMGGVQNVLIENGESSYNNWRGAYWGATGWAPCGFKFAYLDGAIIRDYEVMQNHATGGWMDDGNKNVLFERFYSINNFRAGLSLEANFGPIVIRDSIFYGNTVGINGFDNSGVLIQDSFIFDNSTGQVRMAGSTSLTEEQLLQLPEGWQRGRQSKRHIPENWTLENNFIGMTRAQGNPYFYRIDVRGGGMLDENNEPRYKDFPDTFTSLNNKYAHPNGTSYLGFPNLEGGNVNYATWQDIFDIRDPNEFISNEDANELRNSAESLTGIPLTGFTGAVATAPIVTVVALEPLAFEHQTRAARFRITRKEGDVSIPLIVSFNIGGTAEAGIDFEDPGDRVQIESGDDSAYVTIIPISDGIAEFLEDITLTIEPDLDGNYRLANPRVATITIVDADSLTPSTIEENFDLYADSRTVPVTIRNPGAESLNLRWSDFAGDFRWLDSGNINGPAFEWDDIQSSGSNVNFNWTISNRDGISNAIPLGFDFPFYGQSFNSVYVHSNGFITFEPLADPNFVYATHIPLPNGSAGVNPNTIAGFWTNLAMVNDSRITTRAEDQRFIVQYKELNRFPTFGSPQRISFQIILYASGVIEMYYDKNTMASNTYSIGLQGPTADQGLGIAYNADFIRDGKAIRIWTPDVWIGRPDSTLGIAGNAYVASEIELHPGAVFEGLYRANLRLEDEATGESLFILPVEISVGDVILDGNPLSAGWVNSKDLGRLYALESSWYYSSFLSRWIYLHSSSTSNIWIWDADSGWLWSHHRILPWVWSVDSHQWSSLPTLP